MEYLYYLANASLTLRVVEYLHMMPWLPVRFVTVIHQIDGWVVKVKVSRALDQQEDGDFQAFLNELGVPHEPEIRVQMALWGLETGQSPVEVMRRYQVAVVSHGTPDRSEIEEFRKQFVQGLGYCPETLA
jgi:membrane-bound lytic murein transglycosylase B